MNERLDNVPENVPQRSVETTLALHGIISTISDRMYEKGANSYNGAFKTKIKHQAVFPEFTCDGSLVITYIDNLVNYADFVCSARCEREEEWLTPANPHDVIIEKTTRFSLNFEDLGFITKGQENVGTVEDPSIRFLDDSIFESNPDPIILTDDDLQDLIDDTQE